jgi:CubicO group peptidase (beta-lactamase class C family)
MHSSIRTSFVALALCLLATATHSLERVAPAEAGLSPQRLNRLTQTLRAYVDEGQLAGGVTLVARRGHVAYLESYGHRDREAGAPMPQDAIFRIASQSKAIVSVGVMMLVEDGRLLLSDPVGRYLTEFRNTTVAVANENGGYDVVPASRPINVRDLLTHTSGIGYGSGPAAERWREAGLDSWYFADRDEPIRETVSRIANLPAAAHPGAAWVYGYSTDILGALIEEVSGLPLDRYLEDRVFQPLGMSDTHFYLPEEKARRLAAVYSMRDGRLERAPDAGQMGQGEYINGPRKSFSGGAGLLSTAADYARFLQMMLNGGELDGQRILSPKTVELMTVNHLGNIGYSPGQGFGLGFSVLEDLGTRGTHGSIGEFGWGGAYHTTYWVDPVEEMLIVHLTQLIPATGVDDAARVRALVYQAIVD